LEKLRRIAFRRSAIFAAMLGFVLGSRNWCESKPTASEGIVRTVQDETGRNVPFPFRCAAWFARASLTESLYALGWKTYW